MAEGPGRKWRLVSNHGLVLGYIAFHPDATLRQMSQDLGLTERAIHRIVSDLEDAGLIAKGKKGRRNAYSVLWGNVAAQEASPGLTIGQWAAMLYQATRG